MLPLHNVMLVGLRPHTEQAHGDCAVAQHSVLELVSVEPEQRM